MSEGEPAFDPIKAFQAASSNPDFEAMLKKALGPNALELLKAAASETLGPLVIGQPVTDPGIKFGELEAGGNKIQLYLIPDFLRHPSGKPVEMNGKEAREAVTALNGGIQFGDGSEKANSDAVARREFKNGTLILPRQSDLSDKNPALNEMISNLSPHDSWCVTSTRGAGRDSDSSPVIHVRLKGDDSVKGTPIAAGGDKCRSRVVVLRGKVSDLHS